MSLISLTDYRPMPRYDGKSWTGSRVEGATDSEGPWSGIATVTFDELDSDPAKPIERNFTVSLDDSAVSWLRVVFIDEDGEQDVTNPVPTVPTMTELATIRDVALRLGRFLSDSEEVQVNSLITSATNVIYGAVDKPLEWEPTKNQRDFLSGLCIEVVVRAMANPHALYSLTETLGQHSVTQMYSRDITGGGMMLLPAEELAARRIVYGTTSGSARTRSVVNDVAEGIFLGDTIDGSAEEITSGEGTVGPPGPAGPVGPAGAPGEPGATLVSGQWDYATATTEPPATGQIRTTPDPVEVGQSMTIYLSARDANGLYWEDESLIETGDEVRLRGSAGAVQHCRVTSVQLTAPGPGGYVTVSATLEASTGQIAKNASVEVTLIRV